MEYKKVNQEIFNSVNENIQKLTELFPSAIKDGELDIDALKEELGEFKEVGKEKFELTWAGKQGAKKAAGEDIIGRTLKYIHGDSKNPETTDNIYIEGDNLEVLKALKENYYNSIKMIYIDPPYNTGNDFVYNDKFSEKAIKAEINEGDVSDSGERYIINQKSTNRFHANWLNMMYPRLKVARELLKEDGLIFISIDENEHANLKVICDEIFKENNFICELIWQNKKGGGNDSTYIAVEHEYILCYAKNRDAVSEFYEMYSDEYLKRYKEEDEVSKFYWDTFKRKSGKQYYPIECPDGQILDKDEDGNPISWLRSEKRFKSDLESGDIRFVDMGDRWSVQFKQRLPKGKKPRSIFTTNTVIDDKGTTSSGSNDVYDLFSKEVFSNPKPVELLEYLLGFAVDQDEIVLDFFSGSGSLAEAIFKLNEKDNAKRKFILVQLKEDLDIMLSKTPANKRLPIENAISVLDELGKAHYITEIAKERIRKAGDKVISDNEDDTKNLDIGFKVFTTADTNIRWTKEALEGGQLDYDESMLSDKDALDFIPGFTDIDVVYEVMLRQRDIPLSSKIEKLESIGDRTYMFADSFVVSLEEKVTEEMVEALAAIEPLPIKFIFRDSAFEDDIELKDTTFRKLQALIERNTGEKKKAYTVEFI
ncbi:MAG: site-specific DNA-methyltransferase [Clostridiaceae bacterium]|nr:site-specific DNA-methyltransferase [Clostridiaceae bacterium]